MVGFLTIHLRLPGCSSLKEKRGRLKPLLHQLHKKFNVSVAEMDRQDLWQEAIIACAMVNSDGKQVQRSLQAVVNWVEGNWPDGDVIDEKIEIIEILTAENAEKKLLYTLCFSAVKQEE